MNKLLTSLQKNQARSAGVFLAKLLESQFHLLNSKPYFCARFNHLISK